MVDEEYLNAPDTVYPVTIDPGINVGASGIEDATIYSNYRVNEGQSSSVFAGNYSLRYSGRGTARLLVKFPGLFSNSTFNSLNTSQIQSVTYYVRDVMCESEPVWIDCYRATSYWTESSIKCNYTIWNAYTGFLDDALVYYNNGTAGYNSTAAGHWYGFDITNAVKGWKNGSYANNGIMLKAYNESQGARTFASAERAQHTPVVVVDYGAAVSQVCLSPTYKEMEVDDTAYLSASVVPYNANQSVTFTSSNSSVVSVGYSSGLLCAKSPGTATITARSAADSSKYATCTVKVLRKAIIIVPGVMGTELELVTAQNGLAGGTQVWPPIQGNEDFTDPSVINATLDKLASIQCDESGNSIYNVRVKDDNHFGAFDEYKTLYTQLSNTYSSNHDVIFFGYDWRQPNSTSGAQLRAKVNEYDKVIIVAHSMGGLVTSHMLTNTNVRSKIEKVITLGTPYLGSLEMLPILSHGHFDYINTAVEDLPEWIARLAKETVLQPMIQAMAVNIPSLYELLPNKKFFSLDNRYYYSISSADYTTFAATRTYLPQARKNDALGSFNMDLFDAATECNDLLWNGNSHVTSNVNCYYIAGESIATLRTYKLAFFSDNYSTTSVTAGDGTVLSYSATMNDLYSSRTYFALANHGGLTKNGSSDVSDVIGFIKNLINGNTNLTKEIKTSPRYPI